MTSAMQCLACGTALIAALGFSCVAAGAGAMTAIEGPILSEPLPDPYVYQQDGYYYVFGTGAHCFAGTALEPSKMKRFDLELDFGELKGPFQIWSFKVYRHTDNTPHAYATVHFGDFVTAIGHFLPVEGQAWEPGRPPIKWVLDRILLGDRQASTGLYYDSNVMRDKDGALYLFYNHAPAFHRDVHIKAQRMSAPDTLDTTFAPRTVLMPEGYRSEDRNPGYIQIVEATHIAQVQGKYVLIYSVGDFVLYEGQSNYKLGVAFSDSLIPPEGQTYKKVIVPDPEKLWANKDKRGEVCYLLQSQVEKWPNYCREYVNGPGLGNILQIDGMYWLVFHGYLPDAVSVRANHRNVFKMPIQIDIRDDRPMQDWIRPFIQCSPESNKGANEDDAAK